MSLFQFHSRPSPWQIASRSKRVFEKTTALYAPLFGTLLFTFGCFSLIAFWFELPPRAAGGPAISILQMPMRYAIPSCILGFSLVAAAAKVRVNYSGKSKPTVAAPVRFLVALTLLIHFIGVNIVLSVALNECSQNRLLITQTYGAANAFKEIVAALRTAESGQRGYLLTGKAGYLKAYREGLRRAMQAEPNRASIAQGWPLGNAFDGLARQKISELIETVRLRETGRYAEAIAVVQSGQGLVLMEQIEAVDAQLGRTFTFMLAKQNSAYRQAVERLRRSILASYAIAFTLLNWAAFFFYREIKRRTWVETQLRAHELELASHIKEQTEELQTSESRYQAMLDQSPIAIHVFDRHGNSIHVNPAFERMVGVSAAQMKGYNILTDPQPSAQGTLEALKCVFAGGTMVTQTVQHLPRLSSRTALDAEGARGAWAEVIGYPVKSNSGEVREVVLLCHDVTDRELALISVRENEQKFRELANVLPQIVWTAKPDGEVEYFNDRWYGFTGTKRDDERAKEWEPIVHPNDLPVSLDSWGKSRETETHFETEQRLWDRKREEYRWHLARAVPIFDVSNAVKRWIGTTTDIHEQKEAEEVLERKIVARTAELQSSYALLQVREDELRRSLGERDVLLREVHHRVKNNLQIISSLLRMQSDSMKSEPSAAIALEESRRRVLSMAMIHERLYANPKIAEINFAEYTETLVRELVYSYSLPGRRIESRVHVGQLLLNVDQAIPCGLILNELVTNALKYAFGGRKHGEIYVGLQATPAGVITMAVHDDGVGLSESFNWNESGTLGLPIVDILARQLDGSVRYEFRGGARFTISFPMKTKCSY